ncbi:hypothetical protein GPALN_005077 [Globodera pallida]|nr:hypothetical protein GPALN_005077 [Globodera pallida]
MRAQPETVHAKNAELQQFRAKLNQIELELKDIGDQLKEELRGMKQLCTNFEKMEQCQRKQQQTPQGETSDKIVTPFTSNKMKSDHPLMQQQTLKSPIWDIDLFEQRRFRNGNTEAQCMECGQKFETTDAAAMTWHIVQEHPRYAAILLQKQLDSRSMAIDRNN